MRLQYHWLNFNALQGAMASLADVDSRARPLMERWTDIIVEGNRRGVMTGTWADEQGFEHNAPPLKYRPGKPTRARNRKVPAYGTSLFGSSGAGPYMTGLHDNLTTEQYKQLSGPRLAPRGDASRVIKNLHKEIRHYPERKRWEAIGAWHGVVDFHGNPFLMDHFEGRETGSPWGRFVMPRMDLRWVRPADMQFAINALSAFVKQEFLRKF